MLFQVERDHKILELLAQNSYTFMKAILSKIQVKYLSVSSPFFNPIDISAVFKNVKFLAAIK